jgi:hypothetical protein
MELDKRVFILLEGETITGTIIEIAEKITVKLLDGSKVIVTENQIIEG